MGQYAVKETGCVNNFGFHVPCHIEGEARRKRSADDEAAAAPAVLPLNYGFGFPYSGYHGLPYAGYHGLPYAFGGYHYPYTQVKIAEPEVTEVEVPHYVYKPEVETVELAPLCHNYLGFPVPCSV